MNYDQFLLALVMWREARGEGPDGMRAVGHVILNRTHAWGQTLYQAIIGRNQFSSITVLGDSQTVLWPLPNDPVFALAAEVYNGTSPDPTGGALYYANESAITSEWYQIHIVADPAHEVTAQIGHHTFRK